MATLLEWWSRVLGQFRRGGLERQTEAEMQLHFELEVDKGLKNGLSRPEAERQARLKTGSVSGAMEPVRDQRGLGWLDGTTMDLRHAWAALRRRPGFLFIAGGALAAAVAINTLIFTIVDGVILHPLPYPHPERLVRVFESTPRNAKWPISIYNYLEDRRLNRTLEGLALYTRNDLQLMHDNRPERVTTLNITEDFLPVLGVSPLLGRNFLPSEMHGKARVVMLSHTLWTSRFHADPAIIGQTVRLDRENWTVVGVLPAGFQHVGGSYRSPQQGETVALWSPLDLDLPGSGARDWHFTNAIARLKPGVSRIAADEDLNRIMDDLRRRFPNNYSKDARAQVEPLSSEVVGRSNVTVDIIVGAGLLVLLVACINIAGLCVARVLTRKRELAIRQALGGSAWRLIRAVLSESLILGCVGGAAGLALAGVLFPVLRLVLPADFPRLHEIGFSAAAAAFAFVSALLTSTVAGLVPAFQQIGVDPRDGLSEDNRTSSGSRRVTSLRGGLVAAEVALSCILCFGAVLLVRSSRLLDARDHGFDAKGVLTFQIFLPEAAYKTKDQRIAFDAELVGRLAAIPGVQSAGLSTNLPWTGYDENTGFDIVGRPPRPGESMQARYQAADPGYLAAMRFRLVRGRWIQPGDRASSTPVIVINEALARRYFENVDPVGHYLDFGDKYRIVGVVADVRDRPAAATAEPAFWWPMTQAPSPALSVVVRTGGDPLALVTAVRGVMASLDRELPLAEIRSMDEIAATALAERHFALWLCETFAALAMVLAAIGTYGMLTYLVEQRRREIGIRLALGASRPGVLWMILSNGLLLAAFGICTGLLIAPLAGKALASMLYGVSVGDALTFIAAPALILLITCLGSLAPGWAAARTEPMSALRDQ